MAQSMTVTNAVLNTYLLATGKATPPAAGTTKYTKILALLNMFTQNWASETGIDWKSLRDVFTIGVVSATDTYTLPDDVGKLSRTEGDFLRVYHTDGKTESDYTVVPIEKLYDSGRALNNGGIDRYNAVGTCAVQGSNLIFSTPFTAQSSQFGGTMKIPGYVIPDTLVNGTDTIQVDDPFWLCFMAAAEYVRNDLTRVAQYGNLIAQANNSMIGMKEDNASQVEEVVSVWSPIGDQWS